MGTSKVLLFFRASGIQEALDAKVCDLKVDKTPTVTLQGKGRKIRIVPLMQNTVKLLQQYMGLFHPGETWQSQEYLFYTTRNGVRKKMSDDAIRIRFQKYAVKAKEKCGSIPDNIHPHLWRHTRAMHLYQHGMDLTLISQWLGHSNLETTLVYAHADTEHKRKAIEKAMGKDNFVEGEFKPYTINDEDILRRLYSL